MEHLLTSGQGVLPSEQLNTITAFLSDTRNRIRKFRDANWQNGVTQEWPLDLKFRETMIDLLKKAWETVSESDEPTSQ